MNKRIKIFILFFLFIIITAVTNNCYGKSYSIDNMNIEATILEDGSVSVKQEIQYTFKGQYNGVYITIPYELNDKEYDSFRNQGELKDSLYTNSGVEIKKVEIGQIELPLINYASTAPSNVYSVIDENSEKILKIFSSSYNETKNFQIEYILKNVCVKHEDVGELYYNFIGGRWDTTIKNLNIDVYLNTNNSNLSIWGHGNYNGFSEIISSSHAIFKTQNVRPGEYVGARLMFDIESIPFCTKTSGIMAKSLIMQDEDIIGENIEAKKSHNKKTILFCLILFIYWIILLLAYEADKKRFVSDFDDEELFDKYNPLIAGCLQGSRDILARDIIAVILNLVNKKIIKLDLQPVLTHSSKGNQYMYIITKVPEKESELDKTERYIYNWIFEKNDTVELSNRLKMIPKERDANVKFKNLDALAKNELNVIGANRQAVPKFVRFLNNILLILTVLWGYVSIQELVLNIFNPDILKMSAYILVIMIVQLLPVLMLLIYIPVWLISKIRRKIIGKVQKISGQKVVSTSITILIISSIFMVITGFFSSARGLVLNELLITISLIICLTDNLMLKNSNDISGDYSKLHILKDKIKDYTLSNFRDMEQIFLWDRYLAYAVSFGIADKIIKRIGNMVNDEDLIMVMVSEKTMLHWIYTDYGDFYRYASLDSRFLKSYGKSISSVAKAYARSSDSGSHGGSGGGFSGGGGYHGRWWTRPVAGGAF